MNADVLGGVFAEFDAVVFGGFTNVRECDVAFGSGYTFNLIEPRNRIANVLRIGERLFTLFWERVDAIRKIALTRQDSGFVVRFPCRFHNAVLPRGGDSYALGNGRR